MPFLWGPNVGVVVSVLKDTHGGQTHPGGGGRQVVLVAVFVGVSFSFPCFKPQSVGT